MQKLQTRPAESAIKSLPEWLQTDLSEFIAHIKVIRYLNPDGKPKPEWKVSYGRTLVGARKKALLETQLATESLWGAIQTDRRDRMWNSEQRETLDTLLRTSMRVQRFEASKEARALAWGTTMNAILAKSKLETWHEIKDMVWAVGTTPAKAAALIATVNGTARCVAMDAAEAAALMARAIVVKDLDFLFKETHIRRAARRMEVWEKGYCLAGDVDGILYVYCACECPPEQLRLRI